MDPCLSCVGFPIATFFPVLLSLWKEVMELHLSELTDSELSMGNVRDAAKTPPALGTGPGIPEWRTS